jgi:antitoxin PrlF
MQTLKLSAVQKKGQITIPAEIRRKWGLRKGDLVAFVETEAGIVIAPQEVIAMEALDQIGKILREKGVTIEELIESGREIRGKTLEEEHGLKANARRAVSRPLAPVGAEPVQSDPPAQRAGARHAAGRAERADGAGN